MTFDAADLREPAGRLSREWLEANGLGGWASSTLANVPTRKYHGLLVAAARPPVGRAVLLESLHETVAVGEGRYPLGGHYYPNAPLPPNYLTGFARGLFPVFTYQAGGLTLRKTVAALHHENTTVLWYEVLAAPADCRLEWLPLLAARDAGSLAHQNPDICQQLTADAPGCWRVRPYATSPPLYLHLPGATHQPTPAWYARVQYPEERARGYDFEEDLFGPGPLRRPVAAGAAFGVIVSTRPVAGRDPAALLAQERKRRSHLTFNMDHLSVDKPGVEASARMPGNKQQAALNKQQSTSNSQQTTDNNQQATNNSQQATNNNQHATLLLAADQFVVRRGEDLNSVIAGYPWFADWGRDTMIALPGLCLSTGRPADAARILRAFAGVVSQGMLPNRFPDSGAAPEYNTVDATLWFFVAIHHYAQAYPADHTLLRDALLPVLADILAWHERGTRYGIRATPAGLLHAGAPGQQLTWMDAKIGDWVVTPRRGYPVEVQALWYNALCISAALAARYDQPDWAADLTARAAQTQVAFAARFWNEAAGCLYDCLPDDGAPDARIRPNQVLALSLPFPLTTGERAARVLEVAESQLLTPRGLRSLAPTDPAYQPYYRGSQPERDAAYHQGTVWSWLLGPYVDALLRVRGPDAGRQQARQLLAGFAGHLREAGVGSVSEVFDGAAPHAPGGCPAQAWGVGEVLRVLTTYDL